MKTVILNPIEHSNWDSLLEMSDQSNFFHTSTWARVLSESYGYKPLYFTLGGNGHPRGLIPIMEIRSYLTGKRGVSLPFSDMCEPFSGGRSAFDLLLHDVVAYGRQAKWKHIELRGGRGLLEAEPVYAEHLVHMLDLSAGEVEVSKRFKPNILRNVRKAQKEGVKVKIESSIEAMSDFYKLNCATRKRHGLPPQPWTFFRKFHQHVIAGGMGFLILAEFRNHKIAGAVFAKFRKQVIYKYGASDSRFQHLRANNLVMWEAIRWCCRNGVGSFSFGRTEPENEGLLQFKRGWGSVESRLQYHKFDLSSNCFVADRVALRTSYAGFKTLPLPILRFAGNLLYRHVG